MFVWAPGIPIMYNTTESEDVKLDEGNTEVDIIEDIVEEVIEE